jgi:enterochelin esterase-like enzyme
VLGNVKILIQPAAEGNLEGDAVDRDLIVFLPAGYAAQKNRRYPVVYVPHGYSIGAELWTKEIHLPQTIEGAFAQGVQKMIVVLPDSKTMTRRRCLNGLVRLLRRYQGPGFRPDHDARGPHPDQQ